MKRRSGGFSLLEALITLTLMSILLGVVASLMRDASILMRQANADPMVGLQASLTTIAADLRCAYKLTQCDNAAVAIIRLDPWDTERVPYPLPNPAIPFSLHGVASSRTVRYFVQDSFLWCQTDFSDGSSETYEVAPGISAMDGSFRKPDLVDLSLSTQDTSSNPVKVLSLQTQVVLHLPEQVMP